jgi:hypothetical protein
VTVSFTWPQTGGAVAWFVINVTYNGAPFPGSPFNVGYSTTVVGGPLPGGTYTISVTAVNPFGTNTSFPTTFAIGGGGGPQGPPGQAILNQPTVNGSVVTLTWVPPATGGAPDGYDIEAIVQATGQVLILPVGNQTSTVVPGVPAGNFFVRIRARNAYGVGPWSPQRLVVVGVVINTGDMQVTLTWNSTADIDLHVIEPNGSHVYYANKNGTTARLDVDDTNGYGPENIYVSPGNAASGTYQVYVVHYSGSVPTTSTVTIRLFPGSSNERLVILSRQSSSGNPRLGFNVANVNILGRTISETTGTRATDERETDVEVKEK